MGIEFFNFAMNNATLAPVVYKTAPHQTTNRGVMVSSEIIQEIRTFLKEFNAWLGINHTPYYRIDAYFDDEKLYILELNAAFVDGWGTALNLARASNISIDSQKLVFPEIFTTPNKDYLPELTLLINELSLLGIKGVICEWNGEITRPTYVYGRIPKSQPCILPRDGIQLDNKLNLGLFSKLWKGKNVVIPRHFIGRFNEWEHIPQNVVLKFCDKESVECLRARHSVIFGKPSGKAPFLKRCYRTEILLAQGHIQPMKKSRGNCQLVILTIGDEPITGYVQYSQSDMINDNSVHGPLYIC